MATEPDKKETVSSAVIAQVFGITTRRVQQLFKEDVIPGERRNNALRFDLQETCKAYIQHLRDEAAAKNPTEQSLEKQRLEEDVRLKRAKAEEAELELDELRGNLHRSSDVEEAINGLVYSVRSNLTALPGRLAKDAYGAKSEAEVSQIVKREIELIMRDLSNYLYDPDVFARLVRERHGWDGDSGFESDSSEVV